MEANRSRRLLATVWILAVATLAAAPGNSQPATATFAVEISGMVAFAKTTSDELDVLLVNEFDPSAMPDMDITHFPLLELSCSSLQDAALRKDCAFWATDLDGRRRVVALDAGFEVRIVIPGAQAVGKVQRELTFLDGVVSLAEVAKSSTGKADAPIARKEVFASATAGKFAKARTRLAGGTIGARLNTNTTWRFRKDISSPQVKEYPEIAQGATWSIPYDPDQGARIELWPYGATAAARVFHLKSKGDLTIGLSNEPDALEFCAHSPSTSSSPFEHFRGFWRLSKLTRTDAANAGVLPVPFADDPQAACPSAMSTMADPAPLPIAGRRVNCMMTLFDSEE
jgi:hypothetical protein